MQVSHIVSLYTKRNIIPHTLRSIMQQEGGLQRELILVDDNSKDDTVAVAREVTNGFDTKIIENSGSNKGPSVRLNQGAAVATGKYLHFLDHDDIVPANAIKLMYDILEKTGADFLYGRWSITDKKPQELLGTKINENAEYELHNNPLEVILHGKFKRMCVLVRKEIFEEAGGFDPAIFIQDESLPLRLANVAKTMVVLKEAVNLVPKGEGNLSDSKIQLNHDRFMAYYNFFRKCQDIRVYRRAISAAWKQTRSDGASRFFSEIFFMYLLSRKALRPNIKNLEKLKKYFDAQTGVLKP